MAYIQQKTLPVIVNTEKYDGNLSEHICLKEYPELFEVVEQELPKEFTTLNYRSKEDIEREEKEQQ
jgi:hemerythrin-like domain-containing protein